MFYPICPFLFYFFLQPIGICGFKGSTLFYIILTQVQPLRVIDYRDFYNLPAKLRKKRFFSKQMMEKVIFKTVESLATQ